MRAITLVLSAFLFLPACLPEAPAPEAADGEMLVRKTVACGGFLGTVCDEGFTCVDNPDDGCDPDLGGADCAGTCKRDKSDGGGKGGGKNDECTEKRNKYIANAEECATIRFTCDVGEEPFFDPCGCGCRDIPGEVCGDYVCDPGLVCCNASCGICTEPEGVCTQQVCSDGI